MLQMKLLRLYFLILVNGCYAFFVGVCDQVGLNKCTLLVLCRAACEDLGAL